jgi:hypothetical protein
MGTLLGALLAFTFGFDFFGHVCKVYYSNLLELLSIRRIRDHFAHHPTLTCGDVCLCMMMGGLRVRSDRNNNGQRRQESAS